MTTTQPEFELVQERDHSLRYLSHAADSPLIRWHYHHEFELHLLRKTQGKAFIGDYIGRFKAGTIFLCGPNLPHNWITTSHWATGIRDQVINFTAERMHSISEVLPEARSMRRMLDDSHFGIEFSEAVSGPLIERFDTIAEQQGLSRVVAFLDLMDSLSRTEDYRILSSRAYSNSPDAVLEERVNTVVNFVTQQYQRDITLEEVAGLVRLSPTFFSRYFRKATGHRFIEFLTRFRISKACERLETSSDPITHICFDVGFANVANFNRHFLKIKGMTPRQYRESLGLRDGIPPAIYSRPPARD